jgi:hypothetical protein
MEDAVRKLEVAIPEVAFVAGTRALAGAGIGLLVSEYLDRDTRRALGWTLLAVGIATTVPIAASLIGRTRRPPLLAD